MKWQQARALGGTELPGVFMKKTALFRLTALLLALLTTILVCLFSARFCRAAHDRSIFEECGEPITFSRLATIALIGNRSSVNACINNLRQIDAAKQQWALEHSRKVADVVTWTDLAPYLGNMGHKLVWCPQGGVYRLGRLDEFPTCSISNHNVLH
jgi:hypothetical protein